MEITEGELTDEILNLLKELDPGLNTTKIQSDAPLQSQVELSPHEFKRLKIKILDLFGIDLPSEYFSPSSSLADLVNAVRNYCSRKES
jgi:hypothetical protein